MAVSPGDDDLLSAFVAGAGAPVGGVCAWVAGALAGNMAGWRQPVRDERGSPTETMVGMVPDTDREVTVTLADGVSESVPVVRNLYAVTTSIGFRSFTVRDAAGHRHTYVAPGLRRSALP